MPELPQEFQTIVYTAAGRTDVRAQIEHIYEQLQLEIDLRKPVCNASGKCCKFEEYGHRLYVTTMELGAFVYELELKSAKPQAAGEWDGRGCPFQVSGLCGVHAIRPFGCRIFFCDKSAGDWTTVYEDFHAKLKRLHEELKVPYFYVEWRAALMALGLAEVSVTPQNRL